MIDLFDVRYARFAWVPGTFEIPLIASKMAKSGKYDAVICLSAVIRGSTTHYNYVCSEVSKLFRFGKCSFDYCIDMVLE